MTKAGILKVIDSQERKLREFVGLHVLTPVEWEIARRRVQALRDRVDQGADLEAVWLALTIATTLGNAALNEVASIDRGLSRSLVRATRQKIGADATLEAIADDVGSSRSTLKRMIARSESVGVPIPVKMGRKKRR